VPRDTQLSWNYDRRAGRITTTWKVITEPLKPGASREVIQGFLPHHWRENIAPLRLDGPVYSTIRGALKCGAGSEFTLAYPFNGILPNFPAAKSLDTARTREVLAKLTDPSKKLGGDTYWGGKQVQLHAQAALIAAQTKDPSFNAIATKLRAGMENWLTYSPGEKGQFFAYYPRHKALVGFPAAYGSQYFTDTHFHQGYFVYAAGLLAQLQPDFASSHGDMARLIAKNYANYDRADTRFPRFRTFDIWRGHSFADGKGFPDGNNQESTGEAVNSWAGMILLGEALGDADLTAAGVMGYSFETRANVEYWFDPHGDVFPQAYTHNACGMIWCGSIVWGTWFSASPAWIYGIQWLPVAPHGSFYDRDPKLIASAYADVQREMTAFEQKEVAKKPGRAPKATLGGELGSYHLGFLMHADAPRVVREISALWAAPGDKVARNEWMGVTYYMAAALAELGRADFTAHGDSPTSAVYFNEATKQRTLVAWNPSAQPRTVEFFQGAKPLGKLTVPPRSIASERAR
jgi:endoglucanase Acf2